MGTPKTVGSQTTSEGVRVCVCVFSLRMQTLLMGSVDEKIREPSGEWMFYPIMTSMVSHILNDAGFCSFNRVALCT